MYKSTQIHTISQLFVQDKINDGDQFIFTDAWNVGILQLKYMSKLLNKNITIHGLWHAGAYDKNDFLGRLIGDEPWIENTELSLFNAIDYNWVATKYHEQLINSKYGKQMLHLTGWPMGYSRNLFEPNQSNNRENIIVFPHRIAPEKQINLFKELSQVSELKDKYEFIIPMELKMNKPNRLSYEEMYSNQFKFEGSVKSCVNQIKEFEKQRNSNIFTILYNESVNIEQNYFTATKLLNKVKDINEQ